MTIIASQQTDTKPEIGVLAAKAIAASKDLTWGWGRVAQFLADNLDLANEADAYPRSGFVLIYFPPDEEPAARLADVARRGLAAGATVEKKYDDDYGKVLLHFGPVYVQAYTNRDEVCERVVVGTREVVEEVKDPEALAAVPTITQTRTEEVVEWVCKPILAAEVSA